MVSVLKVLQNFYVIYSSADVPLVSVLFAPLWSSTRWSLVHNTVYYVTSVKSLGF